MAATTLCTGDQGHFWRKLSWRVKAGVTMGQLSLVHVIIAALTILTWFGAVATIVIVGRRIGLFGNRPK